MKRVLVTGAAGFVGANLARRLIRDGHETTLVTGPRSLGWRLDGVDAPLVATDLTDAEAVGALLAQVRPDWIFHLAAHGAYSWQQDLRRIVAVNATGTANLFEAALRLGFEALVSAGTSSEYGVRSTAASEDDPLDPNSVYAVTKAAASMLGRHLSLAHGVPIVSLRLYSAYGPWEDPRRLIPALVLRGLRGGLPPLVDSGIARDFVYVDDVADAFVRAASTPLPSGTVLNVASGVQTTIAEIVELARETLGVEEAPRWGSLPSRQWDASTWVGNPARARELLGWEATACLEEGFRRTVSWAEGEGWPARVLAELGVQP